MKALLLLIPLSISTLLSAQDAPALKLWADPLELGPVEQSFTEPGFYDELRLEIVNKVSSVEVADGYTVVLENITGTGSLVLVGPCRIGDLETIPMLSMERNWDDKVSRVEITYTQTEAEKTSRRFTGMHF